MNEVRNRFAAIVVFVVIGVWSCASTFAQTQGSDRKFLEDTRNSYSLLRRQGLLEVRASILPNWQLMLKDVPAKDKPAALRLSKRLRFTVEADTKGNINVSHSIVGPRPNKATASALDNLAKSVDLSVTAFLMSWAPFMLSELIPENLDQFVLQQLEQERLLTFKVKEVEVSVAISKDFEIKELRTAQGTIKPILRKSKDGFVLTGYEGSNEDPVVGNVVVKAVIESVPTQGVLLPKTVVVNGSAGQTPINFELHFSNYQLKRRI